MDGWAVAGQGPWRVIGQVLAGQLWTGEIALGEAIGIATGAAVPAGASAVLPHEQGRLSGARVLTGWAGPRDHIRPAGDEYLDGEVLVHPGCTLSPIHVGLLAAAGHDAVEVIRRPRARVVVIGDEILTHGPPRGGRVRDSLGVQLPAWLELWGCEVVDITRARDEPGVLEAILVEHHDIDLMITTGSTAAGPADLLHSAFAATDGELLIDGVDCRPGHPMLLGHWGASALVGLPGNPHAAIAGLMTLALPYVQALYGMELPTLSRVELGGVVSPRSGGTRLIACQLLEDQAVPCDHIGSGMLRGLANADGLAVVKGSAAQGDIADWMPWPWSVGST